MKSQIVETTFVKMGERTTVCCIETDTDIEVIGAYTVSKKLLDEIPESEREARALKKAEETLRRLEEKYSNQNKK